MTIFILQLVVSFLNVFLKVLQTQVVVGGNKLMAFIISIAVTCIATANVLLMVGAGWGSLVPVSIGSSVGVVSSMIAYKYLTNRGKIDE